MVDRKVEANEESLITIGSDKCWTCDFFDPQGRKYFFSTAGQCSLTRIFKRNDAGVWHARCNWPDGEKEPLVYQFNLTVTDKQSTTGITYYLLLLFLYCL